MDPGRLASLAGADLVAETTLRAYDEADPERIDAYYAPDATYTNSTGDVGDRAALVDNVRLLSTAFAALETSVEETVEDGRDLTFRYTIAGRHVGPVHGLRPTYESFEDQGIGFLRHDGDRVRDLHLVFDLLGLHDQLGRI
jgi:hypothetical protein